MKCCGKLRLDSSNVEIDSFDGLLVDYAASRNANAILRGIRAISDYENELQMAHLNRRMRPGTETIFLMASAKSFLSSARAWLKRSSRWAETFPTSFRHAVRAPACARNSPTKNNDKR